MKSLLNVVLQPLAKLLQPHPNSQHPSEFTIAPVGRLKSFEKAGWDAQDVDLWEINEAFAMVTILIDDFKLDTEKSILMAVLVHLVIQLVLPGSMYHSYINSCT